jgi:hypothetical protein
MTPNPLEMLLADLAAHGVELQAHGDRLRFHPRATVTPALAERLKLHKAELLAILQEAAGHAAEAVALIRGTRGRGDDDLAEDLAEARKERLAICMVDGHMTPAEAEVIALVQLETILAFRRSNR